MIDILLLRSLNPVTKKAATMATDFGRATPDPGLGASIELSGGHARGLFALVGIGKTLPG